MPRTVLHIDMNNFYASVECLYHPELRGKPVAVCGDPEARHGVVLAKNYLAKACGIKTGNPIWKVFAKLGSDCKKPDATTVIPHDGWQEMVWPLPVEDLLYVGPATSKILRRYTIKTIGDLAAADPRAVKSWLGKCGTVLLSYALGLDQSPVAPIGAVLPVKSIGNSTTMPRDMGDGDDLRIILYILCEAVAERLRGQSLQCRTVQVALRWTDLTWTERQAPLNAPSCNSSAIYAAAYNLYQANHSGRKLRSIGVRGCNLDHWANTQTSLYQQVKRSQRLDNLDHAVDDIRRRYGRNAVRRGLMLMNRQLSALDPMTDHVAVPPGGR